MEPNDGRLVLLTGATGYVGGRLLSRLEQRAVRVRCLSRRPEALRGRMGSTTETVAGDVLVVVTGVLRPGNPHRLSA
jgi:uncharacterized protein YbjT (DUF2867 family)